MKQFLIILSIYFTGISVAYSQNKSVSLLNNNIHIKGANYVTRNMDKITFSRFSEACLNTPPFERMFNEEKGKTTSGIKIIFKTKSPEIELVFIPQTGTNRGAEFAVLQNDVITNTFRFNNKQSVQDMTLKFLNHSPEKETLFEVDLPSFCNVALTKLKLSEGSQLSSFTPQQKPVYLAIGNSITHGVGQGSASYLTYPYLLAHSLNMDYYNLAIGGAKISQAIANQTAEMPQTELITILIGYNDMMSNNKTVSEYIKAYRPYLKTIRNNQPKAKIYCISLTYTRSTGNEKTGTTPNDFRIALHKLVTEFQNNGDKQLFFIAGDKITSDANLRQDMPNDKVHFGVDGARMFAEELFKIIKQ